jgi:hypothetical protein
MDPRSFTRPLDDRPSQPLKRDEFTYLLTHMTIERAAPDLWILTYYCSGRFYLSQTILAGEFYDRIKTRVKLKWGAGKAPHGIGKKQNELRLI